MEYWQSLIEHGMEYIKEGCKMNQSPDKCAVFCPFYSYCFYFMKTGNTSLMPEEWKI